MDDIVQDDENKGMENAKEIREEVVRFFNDRHEDKDSRSLPEQNLMFEKRKLSAQVSIDDLDQATKFLDSQLTTLGEFCPNNSTNIQCRVFSIGSNIGNNSRKTVDSNHKETETKSLTKSGKFQNLSELDEEKIKELHLPAQTVRQPTKYFHINSNTSKHPICN